MNPNVLKGIFEVIGKSNLGYFDKWILPYVKHNAVEYSAEQVVLKTIYYGGTYDAKSEITKLHNFISNVLVTVSLVPGPIGMVASFIDGILYTITGDYQAAGVAFLGMIPGIKQLGLLAKFTKAFQSCPVITKIFSNWTMVGKFFDKIAKNMSKLKISTNDVSDVCGTLVQKANPFKGQFNSLLGNVGTYTQKSMQAARQELLSYGGNNVRSGSRLLSITLKFIHEYKV